MPAAGRLHSRQGHISALAAGVGVSEWAREAQREPERGGPQGERPGASQVLPAAHRASRRVTDTRPNGRSGRRAVDGAAEVAPARAGRATRLQLGAGAGLRSPEPELLGG